ncbi:ribonuclease III domain-containing protein [Fimicolochytrium jonesii]|uniref:ribonuclease III domain-containing protein n=1 Tax=Fimicolochytrium jonesii TaxID=1396493 RepID=UPI0022FE0F06|nr:ribonuclease III domain-containing protein [Fimicolochytrium jonesii]KAI8820172.1 ribonuclease III domain-containing protein [Fimicolochytrium jonesii]
MSARRIAVRTAARGCAWGNSTPTARLHSCSRLPAHVPASMSSLISSLRSRRYSTETTPKRKAQLTAFAARSGFQLSSQDLLTQALTHTSYDSSRSDSLRLRHLGEHVLGLYVTEHLFSKYPLLPADSLKSIVTAYTGDDALQSVAKLFGVPQVMLWKGSKGQSTKGEDPVAAQILLSLIGALYTDKGPKAARQFIQNHFLTRSVELENHLDTPNPQALLVKLTLAKGQVRPISRLMKETGRQSATPVFLVGMYSGVQKIGQGYGSSLKEAEFRAAKDALHKHYFVEVRDFTVPSDMEAPSSLLEEEP